MNHLFAHESPFALMNHLFTLMNHHADIFHRVCAAFWIKNAQRCNVADFVTEDAGEREDSMPKMCYKRQRK